MRSLFFWLILLVAACDATFGREWKCVDGKRTFEGQLVEYRPPMVTVAQERGGRITFEDSLLSPEDKRYCVLAKRVLAKSYASIPFRVIQVMEHGCIGQELAAGNPLFSHETMMIWADHRYSVATGRSYQYDIFWAGSYSYTTPEGRQKNIRSFALSLDQAVTISEERLSSSGAGAQNGGVPQPRQAIRGCSGTGFAITSLGHLVTNAHVIDGARKITVSAQGGLIEARVVTVDQPNDLAILKMEGRTVPLKLGVDEVVKLGDEISVGGFPNPEMQGTSLKLTRGVISGMLGLQDDVHHYQIDASIQPGNSGGPLLNSRSAVVGVVDSSIKIIAVAKATGSLPQNVNYAIKIEYLAPLIRSVAGLSEQVARETYATGLSVAENLQHSTYLIKCELDSK